MLPPGDPFERWAAVVGAEELEGYRKAGMGARCGFGVAPAVLSIDMTKLYTDPRFPAAHGPLTQRAVAAVARLMAESRSHGIPIIHIRPRRLHPLELGMTGRKIRCFESPIARTAEAAEWPAAIAPAPGELILEKTKGSGFFDTPLRGMLTYLGVDTAVVVGLSTSSCVRATAVDAHFCNLHVIVPEDCCADRSPTAHLHNLFDLDMKYADVMTLDEVLEALAKLRPEA